METNYKGQIDMIDNLIIMNNDRVEGYELASKETLQHDLKRIFDKFAQQSRGFATVLGAEIRKLGEEASTATSTSGKFHRAWMEIKTTITGKDHQATLDSCEYGEDVIIEAYNDAIESDATLTSDLMALVLSQKKELKEAHNTIKLLRNTQTIGIA
ncbi:MAG: PA2169 family four-helix-bundle protein [Cytophagales bacterium]